MKPLLTASVMLIFILLIGCRGSDNDIHPAQNYDVVVIDDCQYILVSRRPYDAQFSLTHKGNCNNPQHDERGKAFSIFIDTVQHILENTK